MVDADGEPVEGVIVLAGGAPEEEWQYSDADGLATVTVGDDGITDRWILTGGVGLKTTGYDVPEHLGPDGLVEIEIHRLPDAADDNPDYQWLPGGDSHSMTSGWCGHCHKTIADEWSVGRHNASARNAKTWDLYVGGGDLDPAVCAALGGWIGEGQEPGVDGGVVERCYVGDGVLPFLHDDCGEDGADGCDHPDEAASLDSYGSCGDCHSPTSQADGGAIDFARSFEITYDEGVSCDLCHKIRSVDAGGAPGRDGGMQLQRPSEETDVFGHEFDPITFGPYPDVVAGNMKGTYNPVMRDADWCSSCHEYARGALRPDQQVDPVRWPDGLPIGEIYSEYLASPYAGTPTTCQTCHMTVLDEESSTYNITEVGMVPSPGQGWFRELGEVHHHNLTVAEDMAEAVGMSLSLSVDGNDLVATVTVSNLTAGHAMPSGEPMRQLIVLVEAVDDNGDPLPASGGQAVPDVGGRLVEGELGVDAILTDLELAFAGQDLPAATAVRFVRPTGDWDDYDGPGTASFTGLPAEQKGLPILAVVGEVAVASVAGDTVTLAAAAPDVLPGDRVYLVEGHDRAGAAGWLYGKTLVDGDGNRGVAHFRAIDMASDNRLASGGSGSSTHRFPAPWPGQTTAVTARLIYRDYAAPVARQYGWDVADVELATDDESYTGVED